MAQGYKPYPIYDFKNGKVIAREPWLLPGDAFSSLQNMHIKNGVLEKRRGHTQYGEIEHTNTDTGADTNPGNAVIGIETYYSTAGSFLLAFDTKRVNEFVAGAFVDRSYHLVEFNHTDYAHTPSVDDTMEGTNSGATGDLLDWFLISGTFGGSDANGYFVLKSDGSRSTTDFSSGETVFTTGVGGEKFGTTSQASFDAEFDSLSGSAHDIADSDYIWAQWWDNVLYLSTGHANDQMWRYVTGENATRFMIPYNIEIGGTGHSHTNNVQGVKIVVLYKGRLMILNFYENTGGTYVHRGNRAEWCNVNAAGVWDSSDYVDCPTEDVIVSADFIEEDLIVWFERSIWALKYTSDPDLPFRWSRISPTDGCYARMSLTTLQQRQVGMGATRLLTTDGRAVQPIDQAIVDFPLEWNLNLIGASYAALIEEERQIVMTYVSAGGTAPDRMLVWNYEDNTFTTYIISVNCIGYTTLSDNITLDEISDALDTISTAFDDGSLSAGYPVALLGLSDGTIQKFYYGGADGSNGSSSIPIAAIGGEWNPLAKEGRRVKMGMVDFLVDYSASATFDVDLYVNSDEASYDTVAVDCLKENETQDDVLWKRVHAGASGDFHRIKISHDESGNLPRIHCIRPWFKPVGREKA